MVALSAGKPATMNATPMTEKISRTAMGTSRNTMIRATAPIACVTAVSAIDAPATRCAMRSRAQPPNNVPISAPTRIRPPTTPDAWSEVSEVWRS